MRLKRLYRECTVLRKDGGEIHLHCLFGMIRQILYISPQGDMYDIPKNWSEEQHDELASLSQPMMTLRLLDREITH